MVSSDFNVDTFMCAISKFDVVCDVAMTSSPNVLTTQLRDILYSQCIGNTCSYSILSYSTGRIRVCKIRYVDTDKIRGNPCLVCKKCLFCLET